MTSAKRLSISVKIYSNGTPIGRDLNKFQLPKAKEQNQTRRLHPFRREQALLWAQAVQALNLRQLLNLKAMEGWQAETANEQG